MAASIQLSHYVSGSEPFALGHYPHDPIYPGVLMIRAARRACEQLLLELDACAWAERDCTLERFSFLDVVRPGDRIDLRAELVRERDSDVRIAVRVTCREQLKARGRFSFARHDQQ